MNADGYSYELSRGRFDGYFGTRQHANLQVAETGQNQAHRKRGYYFRRNLFNPDRFGVRSHLSTMRNVGRVPGRGVAERAVVIGAFR